MSEAGGLPKTGWAKVAPELLVSDLEASLLFWRDVLGFVIAYRRPAPKFVYLEHPLGRGVMFQLYFGSIEPALAAVAACAWPIYRGLREVWRRAGDQETGQREFFLQDPDGYLIMVAENLGERPISGATS